MSIAFFWFVLILVSLFIQSFYSMMEMACVSMSKVRLQYYVSKKDRRAEKLSYLLKNTSRLFGTTLIGVNVAMMFGSEFSRLFYNALGLNPSVAPLTQVMIVIIVGELAPMFAARKYSEHTAMLGANILYASAILMRPFLWVISAITHTVHWIFGGKSDSFDLYLNQDEIRKILEEHQEDQPEAGSVDELNLIVSNIFDLRAKTASKIMHPLSTVPLLPSNAPIRKMRRAMLKFATSYTLVYHKEPSNIVGIAIARDLLKEADNRRIGDHSQQPWFIIQDMEVVHILHQFRSNKRNVAIVLNRLGKAVGVITLNDVLEEIFGKGSAAIETEPRLPPIIEKTFPGDTEVREFNELYGVSLETAFESETLAEMVIRAFGHHPETGEVIRIPPYEMEIKESTLLEVKQITIKTKVN